MKQVLVTTCVAGLLLGLLSPAHAAGDPGAGKSKAAACMACHGTDGNAAIPIYPRLAGQYPGYLRQALHEYRDGQRSNPIMKGMVASLSDQDIADIAAYFASQPGPLDTLQGQVQGDTGG